MFEIIKKDTLTQRTITTQRKYNPYVSMSHGAIYMNVIAFELLKKPSTISVELDPSIKSIHLIHGSDNADQFKVIPPSKNNGASVNCSILCDYICEKLNIPDYDHSIVHFKVFTTDTGLRLDYTGIEPCKTIKK